jgi:hypothetical protein
VPETEITCIRPGLTRLMPSREWGAGTCSGWPIEWSKTVAVGDAETMAEARETCDRGLLVACASCSAETAVGFHARRGVAAEAIRRPCPVEELDAISAEAARHRRKSGCQSGSRDRESTPSRIPLAGAVRLVARTQYLVECAGWDVEQLFAAIPVRPPA